MAKQTINIGTVANDGTGDPLRTAFSKTNDNFTELYGSIGTSGSSGTSGVDGPSGTSGSSGTSGVDGPSGTSGSSGTSGVDGSSGSSGTSGVAGTNAINQFMVTLENPTSSENLVMGYTFVDITVSEIQAVVKGSSPSVTIVPTQTSSRSVTGTTILSSDTAITNTTTGQNLTSFNDATIPADNWILLITNATSGTVNQLSLVIKYTVD